jgi:hypothetical protein
MKASDIEAAKKALYKRQCLRKSFAGFSDMWENMALGEHHVNVNFLLSTPGHCAQVEVPVPADLLGRIEEFYLNEMDHIGHALELMGVAADD